jgi:hypothetical protein
VSEEEGAVRFGIEKRLILSGWKLEVAVDIARFAEPQEQDLLFSVVGDRGEHLRFKCLPGDFDTLKWPLSIIWSGPL